MDRIQTTPRVYFVRTKTQLVKTLFEKGGTGAGTFKLRKKGITFFRGNGEPFAFLCANNPETPFFVTCHLQDGKIRYMHALAESDQTSLGLAGLNYGQMRDAALRIWEQTQQTPQVALSNTKSDAQALQAKRKKK